MRRRVLMVLALLMAGAVVNVAYREHCIYAVVVDGAR